jgi:phage replication O-like protein O
MKIATLIVLWFYVSPAMPSFTTSLWMETDMVNPQPTDPHMRIENHIWETLARCDLSGAEYRVLFAILRHTWGWSAKTRAMSQREIASATGLTNRSYITRITNTLAERHFIVKNSGWGKVSSYEFNKHYDQWTIALTVSTAAAEVPPKRAPEVLPERIMEVLPVSAMVGVDTLHDNHGTTMYNNNPERLSLLALFGMVSPDVGAKAPQWLKSIAAEFGEEAVRDALLMAQSVEGIRNPKAWITDRLGRKAKETRTGKPGPCPPGEKDIVFNGGIYRLRLDRANTAECLSLDVRREYLRDYTPIGKAE